MQQGPQGYGPPQGYPQQGYPQQGYPPQGPPPKQGMPTWAKVLIALGIIGLCGVGGCVVCIGVGAKMTGDAIVEAADSAKKADDAAKAAATSVDLATLLGDYKNNEVRADEQYKGKYVVTTGRVREVSKDFTDSIVIHIEPLNAPQFSLESVMCYPPDSAKADAAKLSKGSVVGVKGRVDGKIITSVIVRECALTLSQADKGAAPPAAPPAPAKPAPKKY